MPGPQKACKGLHGCFYACERPVYLEESCTQRRAPAEHHECSACALVQSYPFPLIFFQNYDTYLKERDKYIIITPYCTQHQLRQQQLPLATLVSSS